MLHYLVMWTACTKNCCQATVSMTTHHQSYAKIFLCFTSPKIRGKWSEDVGNDEEEQFICLWTPAADSQFVCLTFEHPITACQWGLPCSHHTPITFIHQVSAVCCLSTTQRSAPPCETVWLLERHAVTSLPDVWPPNNPDLNPADQKILTRSNTPTSFYTLDPPAVTIRERAAKCGMITKMGKAMISKGWLSPS